MPKKLIIGFTGSIGSGCTTAANHLQENGYQYISISADILAPLAKKHNHPFTMGEEKQDFGNFARETLREEYKCHFLDILENGKDRIALECFRNPIEIDFVRDMYPHFYLISLFATKEVRKSRKKIENFDSIDERDAGEQNNKLGQQVRRCVNNSDVVLDNSKMWGTIDDANDFFKNLDSYIGLLEEPYRAPTEKEMMMHLAYSVSLHSKCIQRQVGAVITDDNYKVLSTGYNDVPQDSESCLDLYSECYRMIKKRNNIWENRDDIKYCTYCGAKLEMQFELIADKSAFVCNKCGKDISEILFRGKELDFCRSLHAEENAILSNPNTAKSFKNKDKRMTIFTTTFPCMLCAKKIANSGIRHLIFVEPYPIKEAEVILAENNVRVEAFEGVKSLKFNWIFRKRSKFLKDFAYKRRIELTKLTKGGLT
jgi:deoxycytidylate deaminase